MCVCPSPVEAETGLATEGVLQNSSEITGERYGVWGGVCTGGLVVCVVNTTIMTDICVV